MSTLQDTTAICSVCPSPVPDIDLEKLIKVGNSYVDADTLAGQPTLFAGQPVTFRFVIENTGNTELRNVALTDTVLGSITLGNMAGQTFTGDLDNDMVLDTNETWVVTRTTTATLGQHTNVATVTAKHNYITVSDNDAANYCGVAPPCPDIDVEKSGKLVDANKDGYAQVGEKIAYRYEVTDGISNVPIHNVTIRDDAGTPGYLADDFTPVYRSGDDGDGILENGETWIYTKSVTVTQEMLDKGSITNIVTVKGNDKYGNVVKDKDSATVVLPEEPCEPGTAMTPGFWKNHKDIFFQETNTTASTTYESIFGVDVGSVKTGSTQTVTANPTLQQALAAHGSSEATFLRASTAALANAKSDDLNFCFCEDEMKFSPEIRSVLYKADTNDDECLSAGEVVALVQDVYTSAGNFTKAGMALVASALDAMNNMQHIEASEFMMA